MAEYQLLPPLSDKEYQDLKKDIEARGVMVPIEYDEIGNILDGHHRIKICKELGITEWPKVIREGWTDEEKEAQAIALNIARRHLTTKQREPLWAKMRKAGMTLEAIAEADGTVSRKTIERHVGQMSNVPATITDTKGRKQPTKKKPRKKRSTFLSEEDQKKAEQKEANKNKKREREREELKPVQGTVATIKHCDCMDLIDQTDPIDLLIADPPYFTDGDFTSHISAWLEKVKPTGQAYIFIGPYPDEVAAYLGIETHHMTLTQILVWNYNNTGQKQPNKRYTGNYQLCLYYRGPSAKDINKPADGQHQYACQTVNAPDGRIGDRYHEWQKPNELLSRLIRNSSNEGDFIFDPFAGSGTAILVAASLGRRAEGCDSDDAAIKICVERGCTIGD